MVNALEGFAKLPSPKILPRDTLSNSLESSHFPTPPILGIAKVLHLVKLREKFTPLHKAHTCSNCVHFLHS